MPIESKIWDFLDLDSFTQNLAFFCNFKVAMDLFKALNGNLFARQSNFNVIFCKKNRQLQCVDYRHTLFYPIVEY